MKQKKALVTGSSGLTGSEMVKLLCDEGWKVYGIDADIRAHLFGQHATTKETGNSLMRMYKDFSSYNIDIRDPDKLDQFFKDNGPFDFIVHAAAQPAHEWSTNNAREDFHINAVGTINVLEAYRHYSPDSPFIYVSSSKVSGDTVNTLPLIELPTRFDLPHGHEYYWGVDEDFCRIDGTGKSLFGNSKACGDLTAQEYMRYFNLPIGIFRPVCISGSAHKGDKLHGFLAYVVKCVATGEKYFVNGKWGKQLRDNIHASDLCQAFYEFYKNPQPDFYNIGAGRTSCCSVIEAIHDSEKILNRKANFEYTDKERLFDHLWCVYSSTKFKSRYPNWKIEYTHEKLLLETCSPYLQ